VVIFRAFRFAVADALIEECYAPESNTNGLPRGRDRPFVFDSGALAYTGQLT
jgi:hypothetical protein